MSDAPLPPLTPEPPTTYNILFVCTGNTCRSALAEGIAKAAVADRGWQHVAIQSAGTGAVTGAAASPQAVEAAAERGVDISAHSSRPLTPELVEWADMILAMSSSHLWAAADMGAGDKAGLLSDFIQGAEPGSAIDDPYGSDVETYRMTYEQLEDAIDGMLDKLSAILAP